MVVVVLLRPKAAMILHHPIREEVVDRPRSGLYITSSLIRGCGIIAALAAIMPHLLIGEDGMYRPRSGLIIRSSTIRYEGIIPLFLIEEEVLITGRRPVIVRLLAIR